MHKTIKLVTKTSEASQHVKENMDSLSKRVAKEDYVAMAVVLIRHDGANFVTTRTNGNRVQLLGAVADLQYTLAKAGDDE